MVTSNSPGTSYIWLNGGIVTDASGTLYGCGFFEDGPVTLGDFTVTPPAPGMGGFLVYRMEANGHVAWVMSPRGTAFMDPGAIAVDASGTMVAVTGSLSGGTMIIANQTFTSTGTGYKSDAYVMVLDAATGAEKWGRTWGGTGDIGSWGVAVDSARNILLNGRVITGTMIVNGQTYTALKCANYCMKVGNALLRCSFHYPWCCPF